MSCYQPACLCLFLVLLRPCNTSPCVVCSVAVSNCMHSCVSACCVVCRVPLALFCVNQLVVSCLLALSREFSFSFILSRFPFICYYFRSFVHNIRLLYIMSVLFVCVAEFVCVRLRGSGRATVHHSKFVSSRNSSQNTKKHPCVVFETTQGRS